MHKTILPLLLFILTPALAQNETGWKAGAADLDITPDYPVRLNGYAHRTAECTKVSQHPHANALAIKWQDDAPAIIVTVDNFGVPATVRAEILKRLATAGHLIADERFALHSAHTHSAPMLTGVLPCLFGADLPAEQQQHVARYTEELTAKITQTVITAMQQMQLARLDWSVGRVYFAHNRRYKTEAGFINAPNFNAPTDRALPVLRVKTADGKNLIATHITYACNGTTHDDNEIQGDWAGRAHEEMELRFPGTVCLVAVGCGGDQNPYPRLAPGRASQHGASIGKEIVRLINLPMHPLSGPLNCSSAEAMLPFEKLPTLEQWQANAANPTPITAYHAQQHLSKLARGDQIPPALPYTVQVWNYGDGLLTINLPGEVVVDYSLRFKREFDPARTWVNGCTNDVPCYIPSQRVWEEGGYEGSLLSMQYYGQPARFASGIENIIASAVKKLVPQEFVTRRMQNPHPPLTNPLFNR